MNRLCLIAVAFSLSLSFPVFAQSGNPKPSQAKEAVNILLIHGFNPMLPWSQEFLKGVTRGASDSELKLNIFVESIFKEHAQDGFKFQQIADSLRIKYQNTQIDAVLSDNITSSQFIEYLVHEGLFKGSKMVVFDAMKVYQPSNSEIVNPFQIFNAANVQRQIDNIFATMPKPKRIITNTSKSNLFKFHSEIIQRHQRENLPTVALEIWDMQDRDIHHKLSTLTADDMFIYFPVFNDFDGTNIAPKLFLRKLAPLVQSPIFSFYSTFMGEGIVGGLIYEGKVQGASAVQFALASLGLESMQQDFPTAIWMYDQAQLDRFDLSFMQDRHQVTIVNPPRSIIDEYPLQLALLVMSFAIAVLSLFFYKNRKLNRAYEELEIAHSVVEKTADQAIQASNTKSKFLAIVSHEIRTPINGLMGVLEMLRHTKLDKKQTELLNMGVYSSESLLRTVNDILDFSKLNSKKFTLEESGFSPRELMSEVVQYAEIIGGTSGLTIHHDLTRLVDVPLMGDKSRIKQVFDNLINNAVKFTPDGSISLVATLSRKGNEFLLECSIADTGVGIDESQQETLFKPFNQAQNHLQQSSKGTGLGLSICKELVEIMKGEICLESQLGKGTTITVKLPLVRANLVTNSKIQGLNFDVSEIVNKRILLVEDNLINQEIAKMQLSLYGLNCDLAKDGQECLDKLKNSSKPYDILLMDIQMPRLDGYETTKLIRAGEVGDALIDVPIIALTAHVSLDEQQMAHSAGMNSHINKPVESVKLVSEIYRLVS